jgi:FMN phosphatase YigB (HAD superfamily)
MQSVIFCDYQRTLDRDDSDLLIEVLPSFKETAQTICVASDGDNDFVKYVIKPKLERNKLFNFKNSLFDAVYSKDDIGYKKEDPNYWIRGITKYPDLGMALTAFIIDDNYSIIQNAQRNNVSHFYLDENKSMTEMIPELKKAYQEHCLKVSSIGKSPT